MNDALTATHLAKRYHDGARELEVLRDVNLAVRPGETVAILGRSGTGKTTFLNCLGLLDRPSSGEIALDGVPTADLGERARTKLRGRRIGFVFQHFHLLGELTALENVVVAGAPHGLADRGRAETLLRELGLGERLTHRPAQLSGGEQQRVAIARALLTRPAFLLCDEPTGNLDPTTGGGVIDLLFQVVRDEKTAMILVTHDPLVAARAERILTLQGGALVGEEVL